MQLFETNTTVIWTTKIVRLIFFQARWRIREKFFRFLGLAGRRENQRRPYVFAGIDWSLSSVRESRSSRHFRLDGAVIPLLTSRVNCRIKGKRNKATWLKGWWRYIDRKTQMRRRRIYVRVSSWIASLRQREFFNLNVQGIRVPFLLQSGPFYIFMKMQNNFRRFRVILGIILWVHGVISMYGNLGNNFKLLLLMFLLLFLLIFLLLSVPLSLSSWYCARVVLSSTGADHRGST